MRELTAITRTWLSYTCTAYICLHCIFTHLCFCWHCIQHSQPHTVFTPSAVSPSYFLLLCNIFATAALYYMKYKWGTCFPSFLFGKLELHLFITMQSTDVPGYVSPQVVLVWLSVWQNKHLDSYSSPATLNVQGQGKMTARVQKSWGGQKIIITISWVRNLARASVSMPARSRRRAWAGIRSRSPWEANHKDAGCKTLLPGHDAPF